MSIGSVISYPVPLYQNVPIQPEFYKPRGYFISDITRGITTTVTTTTDNDYVVGQLVRLIIPPRYGARQLNERTAYVISVPAANQVILDLDSRDSDPFIPSPTFLNSESRTRAQILAIGDINSGQINENGRIQNLIYIQGSFQNISPG